jgi:hypothetical protein
VISLVETGASRSDWNRLNRLTESDQICPVHLAPVVGRIARRLERDVSSLPEHSKLGGVSSDRCRPASLRRSPSSWGRSGIISDLLNDAWIVRTPGANLLSWRSSGIGEACICNDEVEAAAAATLPGP